MTHKMELQNEECVDDVSKNYEIFYKCFITIEKQIENKLKELNI